MSPGAVILEANLAALALRHPDIAQRVRAAPPDPRLSVETSRTGLPVPVLAVGTSRLALHSRYDPEKEAARMVEAAAQDGFAICHGLGAAYHLRVLLSRPGTRGLMVLEYGAGLLRSILSAAPMQDVLGDPRLSLVLDGNAGECAAALMDSYSPILSGGVFSLVLKTRVDAERRLYDQALDGIEAALKRIGADAAVQSIFGRRWFTNILGNLQAAQASSLSLPCSRLVLVAAAGPSLEDQVPAIAAARRRGGFLIGVDSALPLLRSRGLEPDAILSLDCQQVSYTHFLGNPAMDTPLVLDLASPPCLARSAARPGFFASGHPFCRLVSKRLRVLPILDTSGGNVTHAALSLADTLGAEEIRLYGADYSYPRGKAYARGTYLYGIFGQRVGRLSPLETRFADFIFRDPRTTREPGRGGFTYRSPTLDAYREEARRLALGLGAHLIPEPGQGPPLMIGQPLFSLSGTKAPERCTGGSFEAGPALSTVRDFLEGFRDTLSSMGQPAHACLSALRALGGEKADAWLCILPIAASLRSDAAGPSELLERTRLWTLSRTEGYLQTLPLR